MAEFRYDMLEVLDGTCVIYDRFTGHVAEIDGKICSKLSFEEADDLIDDLNIKHIRKSCSRNR